MLAEYVSEVGNLSEEVEWFNPDACCIFVSPDTVVDAVSADSSKLDFVL